MYTKYMAEEGMFWTVATHEHRERSNDWDWALGLLAIAGAGLSIFMGNVLFALIIAIAAGSIATLALRGPREHMVRLNPRGLSLDGTLYRWDAVDSFWIESFDSAEDQPPRLLVTTKGVLHPQLVIPLDNAVRARGVRSYMLRFAKEEEQEAHIGEYLAELFGL